MSEKRVDLNGASSNAGEGPKQRIAQVREELSKLKNSKYKQFTFKASEALALIEQGKKAGKQVAAFDQILKPLKRDKQKPILDKVVTLLRALNKEVLEVEPIKPQDVLDHLRGDMHLPEETHHLVVDFKNLLLEVEERLKGIVFEGSFESTGSRFDKAMLIENLDEVSKVLGKFVNRLHSDTQFVNSAIGKDIANLVQLMVYSYDAQASILRYVEGNRINDLGNIELTKDIYGQDLVNRLLKHEAAKSSLPDGLKEYFNIRGQYVIPQIILQPVFKKSSAKKLDANSLDLLSILYKASKDLMGDTISIDVDDEKSPIGQSRARLSTTDRALEILEKRQETLRSFKSKLGNSSQDKFLREAVDNLVEHASLYLAQAGHEDPNKRFMTEELATQLSSIVNKQLALFKKQKEFFNCFRACRNAMMTTMPGMPIG
jgi:hypothetical protein